MSEQARLLVRSDAVEDTARVLRCLGHPFRLQVLDLLEHEGECTVTQIHSSLGVEQAVASQHLTNMWDKGILSRRKEGVHVYYGIGDERALKVLACVRDANCS